MGEPTLLYGLMTKRSRHEAVQRFVNKTLADGKPRGRAHFVSSMPLDVFQDMRRKGIPLKSDQIFLPDNTVLKYRDHKKSEKGATLPFNEFWKLVNITGKPKNVYIDSKRNNLVYVFASRHAKGKVIKVIIQPNYVFKKQVVNAITSIGVVDKLKMKERQYKRVK